MKKILLILCIFSTSAFANVESDYQLEVKKIEDKIASNEDESTRGMDMALIEEYEAYDKLLNKYYNELMSILSEDSKKALQKSQREWLAYRDKEVESLRALYNRDGTIWCLFFNTDRVKLVKDRVDTLVRYLSIEKQGAWED